MATLTATGLALTDARPDFATLAAIGAAPAVRRRVAMASATVIGGLGALTGVLVGLAPGIAIAHPLTSSDFGGSAPALVQIPWALLTGVAVGVPSLAVLATGLAVRSPAHGDPPPRLTGQGRDHGAVTTSTPEWVVTAP